MERVTAKGRPNKFSEERLISHLETFINENCGMDISHYSPAGFAAYLKANGVEADSNYVRHNRAISEYLKRQKEKEKPKAEANGTIVEALQKQLSEALARIKRYETFYLELLLPGVYNHLIEQSGQGLHPRQILKPEKAEMVIVTPKSEPFNEDFLETMSILTEIYEEEK